MDMRQGWEIKKLGEVCEVFEDGDWIESKDQSIEGIRLIQTGNIGNGFFKDRGEKARYISADTFKRLRCTEIFEGDCLVSRLPDPVGRACILPNTGEKMITAVDCTIIRLNQKQINPQWFLFYSMSNFYQTEIQKQVTGATRQRISRKNLGLVPIPIPQLEEQQHIVSILDKCFTAIDKAKANAEQNLKNTKELFDSYLQGVFEKKGDDWEECNIEDIIRLIDYRGRTPKKTEMGIRLITAKNVKLGYLQLNPVEFIAEDNYESWMTRGIPDIGDVIFTTEAPLANVAQIETNEKLAFAQRIIVMQPNRNKLNPTFLKYMLLSNTIRKIILEKGTGATVVGIKSSLLKKIRIYFPKSIDKQQAIVYQLDALRAETQKLEAVYQKKIEELEELKKSILQGAFSGELTSSASTNVAVSKVIPLQKVDGISATDLQAGITALAMQRHLEQNKQHLFHHVKAEKIIHLSEYILNIDLDRNPVKDAAGPNDFPHAKKVESRAKKAGFYTVFKNGEYYDYQQGRNISSIIQKAQNCLNEKADILCKIIDILIPMTTQQAEVFATTYAAWNNLILSGNQYTDEDIITEARENWHKEKLKFPRERFFNAIEWIRKNELLIPKGNGKIVIAK